MSRKKNTKTSTLLNAVNAVIAPPGTALAPIDATTPRAIEARDTVNTAISMEIGLDQLAAAYRESAARAFEEPFNEAKLALHAANKIRDERANVFDAAVAAVQVRVPAALNKLINELKGFAGDKLVVTPKKGTTNTDNMTYSTVTTITTGVDSVYGSDYRTKDYGIGGAVSISDDDDDDAGSGGSQTLRVSGTLTFTSVKALPTSVVSAYGDLQEAKANASAAEFAVNAIANRVADIRNDKDGSVANLTLNMLGRTTVGVTVQADMNKTIAAETATMLAGVAKSAASIASRSVPASAFAKPKAKKKK